MSLSDFFKPSRRAARKKIEEAIRQGVLPIEEIAFQVSSDLEDEVPDAVLRSLVAESWTRMSAASAKLARPTTLERLQAAFDSLDRAGIMSRHYPLASRSDALALIHGELGIAREAGRTYAGYCFYDQHLLAMMSEGALAFCFGPADTPKTYAQLWRQQAEVASVIVQALRNENFRASWSGKAGDVIRVDGVQWMGARDSSGAPIVPIGPRLEGRAPSTPPKADSGTVANVFFACAGGAADAHRLLALIASETESPMYGSTETFEVDPAAVAIQLDDGILLDLVAGESDPSPRGLIRRRDLANECSFLVAIASHVEKLDCPWWSQYPPEKRILVMTTDAGVSQHEGSRVQPVDFASRDGLSELLDALKTAASASAAT